MIEMTDAYFSFLLGLAGLLAGTGCGWLLAAAIVAAIK
jgi:hypothetical protein